MIVLDLSILNQKGTPMFNSDIFANRPAFGIVGRIFISTDTKEFFRDTGTSWELIGGPGSGTITGSGAATQIAFWNSASTITGSNNLWYDSTNSYLGVNTNAPGNPLDVHGSISSVAALNQTTATNNTLLSLLNSGTPLWRIGNFYTAGANDFGIFDVVNTLQQLTIVKATGQTFIGAKTTASGRLVVNSATADSHLQIVGANSPSIRIDNAGSGGTQRFVFGLATATNNFIQGATAGEFCISTQSAGNMLFGMWQTINASEVMRITTANNLLIGFTVDTGFKLNVNGTLNINLAATIGGSITTNSGGLILGTGSGSNWQIYKETTNSFLGFYISGPSPFMSLSNTGNLLVGTTTDAGQKLQVNFSNSTLYSDGALGNGLLIYNTNTVNNQYAGIAFQGEPSAGNAGVATIYGITTSSGTMDIAFSTRASSVLTEKVRLKSSGNLLIGTTTDAGQKFQVAGMLNSGISYRAGTYTNGDTTPSVLGVSYLYIQNSGATIITNFTNAISNQIITLILNDSNTTITRNNAYLSGGLNFTSTAGDTLTLIYDGTAWYEVCRSINS